MAHFEALAIPQKIDHHWNMWALSLIGLKGAQITQKGLKNRPQNPTFQALVTNFFHFSKGDNDL